MCAPECHQCPHVCPSWCLCPAEPDFLFRARELSDLEDGLSPSTRALLTAALPALPVLLLGLLTLEAKDLVSSLKVGGGIAHHWETGA